jgi:hypothetical protein
MLDACKGIKDERAALVEFLGAELDMEQTSNAYLAGNAPLFHQAVQQAFRFEGDPAAWLLRRTLTRCSGLWLLLSKRM